MRLIDADELAKKWTIASPEPYNTDAVEVLDSIREAPTVDAVVVMEIAPDDFCSYGEPKEDTHADDHD